jgi:hypothetical protein
VRPHSTRNLSLPPSLTFESDFECQRKSLTLKEGQKSTKKNCNGQVPDWVQPKRRSFTRNFSGNDLFTPRTSWFYFNFKGLWSNSSISRASMGRESEAPQPAALGLQSALSLADA